MSNVVLLPVSCPGRRPQREALGCRRWSSQAGPAPQPPCPRQVGRSSPGNSSPPHTDCWKTPGRKPSLCCPQAHSVCVHSSQILHRQLPSSGHSPLLPGVYQAWQVVRRGCCSWGHCTVGAAGWNRRENTRASCTLCRAPRSSSDGPWCVLDGRETCWSSSCFAGGAASSSGGDSAARPASWSPWLI